MYCALTFFFKKKIKTSFALCYQIGIKANYGN